MRLHRLGIDVNQFCGSSCLQAIHVFWICRIFFGSISYLEFYPCRLFDSLRDLPGAWLNRADVLQSKALIININEKYHNKHHNINDKAHSISN